MRISKVHKNALQKSQMALWEEAWNEVYERFFTSIANILEIAFRFSHASVKPE